MIDGVLIRCGRFRGFRLGIDFFGIYMYCLEVGSLVFEVRWGGVGVFNFLVLGLVVIIFIYFILLFIIFVV